MTERHIVDAVVGASVGLTATVLIATSLWPNPPLAVAFGICLAALFIGAALGRVIAA